LDGLIDEPRPGRPPTITAEQVEDVVVTTLESTSEHATHWSRKKMAERSGLSKSTVGRIWKGFGLKPHLTDGFKVSSDPLFVDKVYEVVGLYLNPPESAVVLCVDEKSQVQALGRSQPAFPMMPGMPEKRTHDYVRNGTTSLFAAFNTTDGAVISSLHRRHRSIEFRKLLAKIDAEVPADLAVHLICDNYGAHKTPAVKTWLAAHPQFQMHFTPTYSSWLNQLERLFAFVQDDLLRRSHHNSVQQLEADIRGWIKDWNTHPKPFIWTKSADEIARILRAAIKSEFPAQDTSRSLGQLTAVRRPPSAPAGSPPPPPVRRAAARRRPPRSARADRPRRTRRRVDPTPR
jgi:transposase